ncbi:MAG: hypothetical protein E6710_04635, partial [Acinetobacter baumannii]|nr:hypothetical protein [Acinetobacter baumannii]
MEVFLFIAFTHFLALLSPGPDFFLILTSLLQKGRRYTYSQTTLLFIQDSKKTRNNSSTESINHSLRLRLT